MNTLKYATKLNPQFVKRMAKQPVPWGPLGYTVFKRTYARLREDLGRTEEWGETVERCLNAILQYGGRFTVEEIERLYELIYTLKCTPPGRMLWQLGTSTMARVGGDSAVNCWFVCPNEPEAFCFAFDELMLGGGVGFSVMPGDVYKLPEVKGPLSVVRRDGNDVDFIIPDNREGWVELLRRVLNAYFVTGRSFSYSAHCVRGKGERIKGFGGVASGPGELVKGISQICGVFNKRIGEQLQPVDVLDVMNIIGSIVVSGNVRRSAMIALGSAKDVEYLTAKQWSKGVPNWRAMSNNSVIRSSTEKLPDEFWSGYRGEGEPYGLVNLDLMKRMGRLRDPEGYRPDAKVRGTNPSLRKGTRVLTDTGVFPIEELADKTFKASNLHGQMKKAHCRLSGKDQPLYEVELQGGHVYHATAEHEWPVIVEGKYTKVPTTELKPGDKLPLTAHDKLFDGDLGTYEDGFFLGYLLGDGWVTTRGDNGATQVGIVVGRKDAESGTIDAIEKYLRSLGCEATFRPSTKGDSVEFNTVHSNLTEVLAKFGYRQDKSGIPEAIWKGGSEDLRRGFIDGLFSSDGCVECRDNRSSRVVLSSSRDSLMRDVADLLGFYGIPTTVSRVEVFPTFPNGKKYDRQYFITTLRLRVAGSYRFSKLFRLTQQEKQAKLGTLAKKYESKFGGGDASSLVKVKSVKPTDLVEDVWDIGVYADDHCFRLAHCVTGNCAEISLEPFECCDLAELFLPRFESVREWGEAATLMYRVCKTVLQLPFSWPQTQEVLRRNQRIGVSVTGVCQVNYGADDYDAVYRLLEEEDRRYSGEIKANTSVKLTTTKPSGSVSLLPGVTPGVHPAYSRYYIRRIRFAANDPLVEVHRRNGYHVEPQIGFDGTPDYDTQIVSFPVDAGPDTITASQMSAIRQLEMQKLLQTNWADNSVSVTVYYRDEEMDDIKAWLRDNYRDSVKTVSFLRHSAHGFAQAPYEECTAAQYDEMRAKVKPITSLTEAQQWDIVDSGECAGGACPVR